MQAIAIRIRDLDMAAMAFVVRPWMASRVVNINVANRHRRAVVVQ